MTDGDVAEGMLEIGEIGEMTPRTRRRLGPDEVSRPGILTAAVGQIALLGYDGVRLRDIAFAAGVSIGLLQHQFGPREDLLAEALEHHCATLLAEVQELAHAEPDPWRRITALVDRLALDPRIAARAAVWLEFVAAAGRRDELRAPLRATYVAWTAYLTEAIADGVAAGVLRPRIGVADAAALLVGQIDGALVALAADARRTSGAMIADRITLAAEALLDREPEAGR